MTERPATLQDNVFGLLDAKQATPAQKTVAYICAIPAVPSEDVSCQFIEAITTSRPSIAGHAGLSYQVGAVLPNLVLLRLFEHNIVWAVQAGSQLKGGQLLDHMGNAFYLHQQ